MKRFRDHGAAYFRFVRTPGVEPTNNLAEPAIRFAAMLSVAGNGSRGRYVAGGQQLAPEQNQNQTQRDRHTLAPGWDLQRPGRQKHRQLRYFPQFNL